MEYKFWMIYLSNGSPTKCHSTKEEATQETTRLALKHPSVIFFLLEAKEAYQTKQPEVISTPLEYMHICVS